MMPVDKALAWVYVIAFIVIVLDLFFWRLHV